MYTEHIFGNVFPAVFLTYYNRDNYQISKKGEGSILVASARFNYSQCITILAKFFRTGTSPFQGL